jgi:hypothetical protein
MKDSENLKEIGATISSIVSATGGANMSQKSLADLVIAGDKLFDPKMDSSNGGEPKGLTEQIIQYLYKGSEAGNVATIKKSVNAMVFGMMALPASLSGGSDAEKTFVLFNYPINECSIPFFNQNGNEEGAYSKSLTLINKLVKGIQDGENVNLEREESSIGVSLLVPGIIEKVKIIQQSKNKEALIELLARYNTAQIIRGAIDAFIAVQNFSVPNTPIIVVKAGEMKKEKNKVNSSARQDLYPQIVQGNAKALEAANIAFKDFIEKLPKEQYDFTNLEITFKNADMANKKRGLEAAPNVR